MSPSHGSVRATCTALALLLACACSDTSPPAQDASTADGAAAPASSCTEDSPCSEQCPCEPGAACDPSTGCAKGLQCLPGLAAYYGKDPALNVCSSALCNVDPAGIGCGEEGDFCGRLCTLNPLCETDADCPSGVCGEDNGVFFGRPWESRCWNELCETDPQTGGCGSPHDPCGQCFCVPQCEGKVCGGDMSDGCGGPCPGVCGAGEAGCTADIHCPAGYACLPDADAAAVMHCRPRATCLLTPLLPPDCGDANAPCGPCPECPDACVGRECGIEPECGKDCGQCPGGGYCTADGACLNG
jgi:hypothetical protein